IPFILPVAIPISSLFASFLLFRSLSHRHELTALRTSGMSLTSLLAPLLSAALFATCAHFAICSEIAPWFGNKTKRLLYHETSSNPILLLQRQNLIKLKDTYVTLAVKENGAHADEFLLISRNKKNKRLNLLSAKKLTVSEDLLLASNMAFASHLPAKNKESFDSLLIENQKNTSMNASLLSLALKKHRPKADSGLLNVKMLILRALEKGKEGRGGKIEILRRTSLTLSIVPLTLIGALFGIEGRRTRSQKGLWISLLLLLFLLFSYLAVKELRHSVAFASLFAFAPHLVMGIAIMREIRLLRKGLR
ncbi:MAG TPA: LptF/LptG family permease, partial [Chlamydiales bacterium]|nr:LptF/LptG family permease [Chlamydiales bacterium]